MYRLSGKIKRDPQKRWRLPDRIFFGYGACHILAGTYLQTPPLPGFRAERIVPVQGLAGNHIYVTDGMVAFDFHGYSIRTRLLEHFCRGWRTLHPGWHCDVMPVDFNLLDTAQLNARKMLGPDQYLYDARERAQCFIARINHPAAYQRALHHVSSTGSRLTG